VAIPGCFVLFKSLNPSVVEQTAQCAIERASAEDDAPLAHLFNILQDGVAMTGCSARLRRMRRTGSLSGVDDSLDFIYVVRRDVA
jgi:hypothetical protein